MNIPYHISTLSWQKEHYSLHRMKSKPRLQYSIVCLNQNKENIEVCKNCELRYICCDRRIPRTSKKGLSKYENECEYNPYISKFYYEKDFESLKDSGITLNDQNELNINQVKLKKLNKKIWN